MHKVFRSLPSAAPIETRSDKRSDQRQMKGTKSMPCVAVQPLTNCARSTGCDDLRIGLLGNPRVIKTALEGMTSSVETRRIAFAIEIGPNQRFNDSKVDVFCDVGVAARVKVDGLAKRVQAESICIVVVRSNVEAAERGYWW